MPVPMNLTKAMPVIAQDQVNRAVRRVVVMRMRMRRNSRGTVDRG
jgi:hypothetical protein